MVHISVIEARLSKLGFRVSRWFKPEIRELQHILMENEEIIGIVQGRYFGGFALLVSTDRRLLLIDKKIPYLSVEDIRYDMISEINYSARIFDATIVIYTVNKQHQFSSWKHKHHLRTLTSYAQQRVMDMRQYQNQAPANASATISRSPFSGRSVYDSYGQSDPAPRFQAQMQSEPSQNQQHEIQFAEASTEPKSFIKAHLPSPHVPHIMGATAVEGARQWVNPNPYTRGSLVVRKQYSRGA
jgi:hypothetical protein